MPLTWRCLAAAAAMAAVAAAQAPPAAPAAAAAAAADPQPIPVSATLVRPEPGSNATARLAPVVAVLAGPAVANLSAPSPTACSALCRADARCQWFWSCLEEVRAGGWAPLIV